MYKKLVVFLVTLLAAIIPALPAFADHYYTIYNRGSHEIENIYLRPAGTSDWGSDLLSGYFEPGSYWRRAILGGWGCDVDIYIRYTNGDEEEYDDRDSCSYDLVLHY